MNDNLPQVCTEQKEKAYENLAKHMCFKEGKQLVSTLNNNQSIERRGRLKSVASQCTSGR